MDGANDVVVVILQRLCDRFSDRLEHCEMQHSIEGMRGKQLFQSRLVAQIEIHELRFASRYLCNRVDDGTLAVAEVVDDDYLVTLRHKLHDSVGADVAGSAS